MKIKQAQLEKIAATVQQYPDAGVPEIALAGRSNVGKSSTINALTVRKNLARTSQKPGKTRTVNFYAVDSDIGPFRLVDLPGYGYAEVSRAEKEKWHKIIETYLNNRPSLYEVIQLCDIRHKPTVQDRQMYGWIREAGFTGFVIATKADKLSKGQYGKRVKEIAETLGIEDRDLIIPFSAEKKIHLDWVYEQMARIVQYGAPIAQ